MPRLTNRRVVGTDKGEVRGRGDYVRKANLNCRAPDGGQRRKGAPGNVAGAEEENISNPPPQINGGKQTKDDKVGGGEKKKKRQLQKRGGQGYKTPQMKGWVRSLP